DYKVKQREADLVFFWHNGLGPVKDEWSINFMISRSNDQFIFYNEQLGLSYTFPVYDEDDQKSLSKIEFFRVAFPRYIERPPLYADASISLDGNEYPLDMAEDINKIAFKSLQE